ncbi:alpha/beta fold hydrolase [Dongshaea marina]|uniref:alpha/beta fold hydrolase n=1 Tax=Dongshaea marina TaxID=2047966 RepID=UPI000D3E38C8|nr:alpha/beta hydrolase [Dongshaea marina]
MSTLRIEKTNFYYELQGSGEPLVLIAGYGCDHSFWQFVSPILAEHYQVLTFDNLGVGQTQGDGQPLSIELMADQTMALIEALKLKNPNIIGQSMGGAIAQTIAHNHGHKIGKLVLANTSAKFNQVTLQAIESLTNMVEATLAPEIIIKSLQAWVFGSRVLSDPAFKQEHLDKILSDPYPQSLIDQKRQLAALKGFDSTSYLKEITNQTLVIGAEEDRLTLPLESEYLASHIPEATFEMLTDGHASPIEQPEAIAKLILKHLIVHS